ncbi:DUF4402 domain-containing protein [Sphingomonas sp. LY29]|uniref:DUF4402 domain-containing protein n=1 Tax=Sphingomonas sp. LY29 TaxID=3095341 RepID=UPI002D767D84|nr:DUF4402 domain-containing protein [Sphingomonas sp. LY29]WRP24880.1 DUF4402 domain-containing protein [Sphingomonas sp. LY29]
MVRVLRFPVLGGVMLLLCPAAGFAAPIAASPQATGEVTLIRPMSLSRLGNLDFATLGVTTGGTATINPFTGAMTVTGGLLHLAGTPSRALYQGAATKQTVVNIRVPNQPILIRRVGGTETLTVDQFTLDGQDKRALAQAQSFTFGVGARITVPAGTVDGVYTGEIDVTIQYP